MKRYILDTHVLIWFLEHNDRLPKDIREDIEYIQHEYYVSFLSLIEIDNLIKLEKIDLNISLKEFVNQLEKSYIEVYYGNYNELETLDDLEMKIIGGKKHGDYIDRMIIALSISRNYICISADKKFPHYRKNGLELIEI